LLALEGFGLLLTVVLILIAFSLAFLAAFIVAFPVGACGVMNFAAVFGPNLRTLDLVLVIFSGLLLSRSFYPEPFLFVPIPAFFAGVAFFTECLILLGCFLILLGLFLFLLGCFWSNRYKNIGFATIKGNSFDCLVCLDSSCLTLGVGSFCSVVSI
jgi:hypothetical protein